MQAAVQGGVVEFRTASGDIAASVTTDASGSYVVPAETIGGFQVFVNDAVNPQSTASIDALSIQLSNPAAPCCTNPMGVDNISVSR
jgi:hypothetical protein